MNAHECSIKIFSTDKEVPALNVVPAEEEHDVGDSQRNESAICVSC